MKIALRKFDLGVEAKRLKDEELTLKKSLRMLEYLRKRSDERLTEEEIVERFKGETNLEEGDICQQIF
jgi:DNA-binding response OmpR family regulator